MSDKVFQILSWIRHRSRSGNEHSLHSPFLFDWYNKVILNKENWRPSGKPEEMRSQFLKDKRKDEGKDFGAGNNKRTRTVADYAGMSLGSEKKLSILFRIAKYQQPKSILELGTCLGVSAAYVSEGSEAGVSTIEGNSFLHQIASKSLSSNGYEVNCISGSFDDNLSRELEKLHLPWMIYLDGNHTYEATMKYFEMIVERATQDCILVLDDIYWSRGMARAWKEICEDKRVPMSVDLFELGVILFRFNQPKQHFLLKA